jgi:hypothetical protein
VNKELSSKYHHRFLGEAKVVNVVGAVLVFVALLALGFAIWQRMNEPIGSGDYEGTIVERWVDGAESKQSQPRLRLLVESQDHKRFTVKVDSNVYDAARVGMRIRSRAGQIVLIEHDQGTSNK